MATKLPRFEELALGKDDPPFSAWGLYGKDDEKGTLNRLTKDLVVEATKEIKAGVRVSLNWPLDAQKDIPFFNRQAFHKHVYEKPPRCVNDDTWTFNTQSSSQWDGLRHFAYQKERKFYNGVTMDQIHAEGSNVLGVHNMAEHGIVGRGILLDYHSWRQAQAPEIEHDSFKTGSIKLSDLKKVARYQGTEIKFGDILIVRSESALIEDVLGNKGFMDRFRKASRADIEAVRAVQPPNFTGVEQSEDVLDWIWNNFSAVAGDQPAFECWPSQREFMLHEVLLAGWGCPIGELFDLEALAEECGRQKRWSFFLTSEVCNVPGGVASPPNILAIF
ncbi:MAG: hypothetical protein M1820_005847 [Bogoriella megaspora]|nr:MAG: hypothetical protein M1820_005847 [Bogoriella megaspora]